MVTNWTAYDGLKLAIISGYIQNADTPIPPNVLTLINKYASENAVEILKSGSTTAVWGQITGNITNQTDLVNYINNQISTSSYITSVSNTNTVGLDVTAHVLTATVNYQNTATINISEDASGLKADFASMLISQFTNDAGYITGNQTITLSGEASGSGATSITVTLSNAAVIGKVLTGYVSGAGVISATDTILSAIQKLNGNISALTTGVSSVSGTTNRITASPTTGAVIVDISASYVGQTSITTLGTIGTGVWQGTKVSEVYGGTNQSAYTTGDTLYASATNTLSKLAIGTTGQVLTVAGGVPTWATPTTSPLTTKGDLFTYSTVNDRLPIGANATILMADSATSTGNKWIALSGDVTIDTAGVTTIKNGVNLAGDPTTTTQAVGDNSTKIATTAFVKGWINVQTLKYNSTGEVSSTNTTSEELLASVMIPKGTLNANSEVRWKVWTNELNSANAKTLRVRIHTSAALAGTIFNSFANASLPAVVWQGYFVNNNSVSSQIGPTGGSTTGGGYGNQTNLQSTTSINTTTTDLYIIFSTQKATGSETFKISSWSVVIETT